MRQRLEQCASLPIPEPDRGIGSCTGQHGAIGGIGDPRDVGGMRARPEQRAALHLPHVDRTIITPAGQLASIRSKPERPDHVRLGSPHQVEPLPTPHPPFPPPPPHSPPLSIPSDCPS